MWEMHLLGALALATQVGHPTHRLATHSHPLATDQRIQPIIAARQLSRSHRLKNSKIRAMPSLATK